MKSFWSRFSFILLAVFLLIISWRKLKKAADNKTGIITNDLPASMQVAAVALGPLKGLIVDILWWRSERMLENKEFFESQQLSEWITSLQPTYPSVWNYQGFNLAFNISHNFSNEEERWEWIHEGYDGNPDIRWGVATSLKDAKQRHSLDKL